MTPHLAIVTCLALSSLSCGDDENGWTAARQRALIEKSCTHTLMCRPDAYAEDFGTNHDACIAAYTEELAGDKATLSAACFEASLDWGECTIEDCETEDVDCKDLEDKLTVACR